MQTQRPFQRFYRNLLLTIAIVLTACAGSKPALNSGQDPVLRLQSDIDALLADSSLFQTHSGLQVVSLKTGEELYSRNAHKLFHPASNMKLLTTATALKRLGPSYKFATTVFADSGALADSIVDGNIYLHGTGNPDLLDADLLDIAQQLKNAGIRAITGKLIADDSYFDDLFWGSGWMWDDVSSWYWAPISPLAVNDNCIKIFVEAGQAPGNPLKVRLEPQTGYMQVVNEGRTVAEYDSAAIDSFKVVRRWKKPENIIDVEGGLAIGGTDDFEVDVIDAPAYVATRLLEICRSLGISIDGGIDKGRKPENGERVARHQSLPLSEVVRNTNKISDNLSAELLLKTIAAQASGQPGTADRGISEIYGYLQKAGVDSSLYSLADGSGISRYNVVTPQLLTALLIDMDQDFRVQAEFKASLPIAGVDGSLSRRMRGGPAEGVLRAKTGSLRGVSALAGYTVTADGEPLAFSMIMEQFLVPTSRIREIQDQIGHLITGFSRTLTSGQ